MQLIPLTFPLLFSLAAVSAQQPPPRAPHGAVGITLPTAASEVLFDTPRDGELWAVGDDWKARFDASGCLFVPFLGSDAPRDLPVQITLVKASLGGRSLPLGAATPRRAGNSICIDHGTVAERFTVEQRRIEQDFVFARLAARGELQVDVALAGDCVVSSDTKGLRLRGELGGIDYAEARAVDAAGRSIELPIVWTGAAARITIPGAFVAAATLPLVLDPVILTRNNLAPGVVPAQRLPDVATLQSPDRTLVCWQRQFSATDQDTYAMLLDGSLANVTSVLPVDVTTQNWAEPRCASVASLRTWLVVAQVDAQGAQQWIGGRLLDDAGTVGSPLDIDRPGITGSLNTSHPDVGGDPDASNTTEFTVVYERHRTATDHDIVCRRVSPVTGPVGVPFVLQGNLFDQRAPSISKTNRNGDWLVCWQTLAGPGNNDIEAAHLLSTGFFAVSPYTLYATSADETRPSASSFADVDHNGGWYAMVTWETANGASHDIAGRIVDNFGNLYSSFNLQTLENAGNQAQDQTFPDVDSDGTRFVIGYTETSPVQGHDTYATTVSYLTPTDGFRIDDVHSQLGHTVVLDDLYTRIAAWSGGSDPTNWSPLYVIAGTFLGTNDTEVFDYGGYRPGPFFTTSPTHCGTLVISASGEPLPGGTVMIQVPNFGLSGMAFGFPGWILLNTILPNCNCTLGVANALFVPNPIVFSIPNTPTVVGINLAAQGYSNGGASCVSLLDLSDTINFTIQ